MGEEALLEKAGEEEDDVGILNTELEGVGKV